MQLVTANGAGIELPDASLRQLKEDIQGDVLSPTDAGYEARRLVWNGMIDKRPGLIIRCASSADVRTAVDFARRHGTLLSVRGGGHNVAGSAVCDGGVVIDLSSFTGVEVDPATRTVRAAGGTTIGELDRQAQAFDLAVPMGVVTETGIAGLTLGGGLGWLRRKYGLASDNLVAAEVVTAAGELVRTSRDSHPDLFWALQGGGGGYGIVTSFEFQAHPVGPEVYFAFVIHAGDAAREGLRFYRRWAAEAADEISSLAILWHGPELPEVPVEHQGAPGLIFLAMHSGPAAEGEQALQPLRAHGTPIADLSGAMPYLEVQQFFDEDYPAHEKRYYWKSSYLSGLSDEAIDAFIALNEAAPSPESTLDIWQLGGAMARPGPGATAFGDRTAPFLLGIEANWEDAADDDANLQWARRVHRTARPFSTGGEYLNFPGFYEQDEDAIRDTFGGNMRRLAEVKRRYDPDHLFPSGPNIPATEVVGAP